MLSKGSNQYIYRHKFSLKPEAYTSILEVIILVFLGSWFLKATEPKIISPLADKPWAEQVQAAESTPKTDVEGLIRRLTGNKAFILLDIAKCESHYRENAISKTNDYGVFQINLDAHYSQIPGETREEKIQWLLNPTNNILFGYAMFNEQNVNPWLSSIACWGR